MLVINNTSITNYKNLENIEEVSGSLTLSFTSFSMANLAHRYLNEEAVVTIAGYDFKIKQMAETTFSKTIQAVSTFFDLGGHYIDDMFAGTRKLSDLLNFIFKGTGWTFELDAPDVMLLVPNFGNDNALKLLNALLQVGKLEYQILPNQRVKIATQIGPDNGAQYRYGYNIKTLSRVVDTTNLKTRIRGYGADGLNVIYTSPNAEKFGIIEAEPVHDDQFQLQEELANHIKNQLQDEPLISIELDTVELTNKALGERVWLIYEPLGIEMQSRILSKKSVVRNGKLVTESVVIGNALPASTSDLFAEQKLEYDTQNKINRSRFEQTNERITLEVTELEHGIEENKALFEITAREIKSEVTQVDKRLSGQISTANSRITQTASEIRSEVSKSINGVNQQVSSLSQTVNGFQFQVSDLRDTTNQLSTQVSITAGQVSSKVGYGEIISAINQSPEHIQIQARNISLHGAVTVLSELSNDLGTITAGDINISQGIRIGSFVQMRGNNAAIYFGDYGEIAMSNMDMRISPGGTTYFYGRVDFSGATVVGLPK